MDFADDFTVVANFYENASLLIAAVLNKKIAAPNVYQEALNALGRLSREERIPLAIIGGAATIYHGYPRFTKDLDIVVRTNDFEQIIRVAHEYGIKVKSFNPTGFHAMEYKGVPIDVIREGTYDYRDNSGGIPSPANMGVSEGLGFASLASWVRIKLLSGRAKDDADIVEVMKVKGYEAEQVSSYLATLGGDYKDKFAELTKKAQEENAF